MAGLSWSLQAGSRVAGPRSPWGRGAEAVEAPRGMALVLCTGKGQTCCPLGKGVCRRRWPCEMRALRPPGSSDAPGPATLSTG